MLPHLWDEDIPLVRFLHDTRDVVSNKAYGLIHVAPNELSRTVAMLSRLSISMENSLERRREELLAELIVAGIAASDRIQLVPNDTDNTGSDENIIRYINGHFRTLTRKALADRFSYSERQITRIVLRSTGRSLKDYLCDVRMDYIRDMLENTAVPMYEIIEAAGYHNNNNFFRLFRQRFGMTPGEYRRRKHSEPPIEN